LVNTISSPFPPDHLAREVVTTIASNEDEATLQAAFFALLGEANFEAMIAIFEHVVPIRATIAQLGAGTYADLCAAELLGPAPPPRSEVDEAAANAATLMAVARLANAQLDTEAPKSKAPALVGVTVKRTSDKQAKKNSKALKKAAAAARQNLSSLDAAQSDFLQDAGFDPAYLAQERALGLQGGGFRGASEADIAAITAALNPSGTREWNQKQGLPAGTTREYEDGYEVVTVPAKFRDESKLPPRVVLSESMDKTCLKGFQNIPTLNPMQSTVFEAAFKTQENLLICAPTGAGKTNVAMLTVLAHFRDKGVIANPDDPYAAFANVGSENFESGKKVIYIAPMKALAQEVVEKFSQRLRPLKLEVRELTGDMQLTRAEAERTDVIVTTPEKWDVVTRKGGDGSLGMACGLLIIDEVHLLADGRGAVIESVVARLHRLVESSQKSVRIVGLSATLPNYKDVATFLRVHSTRGLFYFGPEHRPVPLAQTFVGVTEKDRWRAIKKMNEICYDTVTDSLRRGYQVMIFVHSRKDTGQTCGALAEIAAKRGELERYFLTSNDPNSAFTKYTAKAAKSRNRELSNHFKNGMGIHHAGMLRGDRKLSESMFAEGAIKVLCCTATLAWGVNLPAHTVIIKGTEVYNAEKGGMMDLSILDVQQIFGRAGRPQFDTFGEAHLITSQRSLPRYLNLLVNQSAIESNFIKQLADHLNAEIVGGTVCNIPEASQWLQYTYLYVRMTKNPMAYGINAADLETDPQLKKKTTELVVNAAKLLDERRMIRYDPRSGNLAVTDLGRVASHFYIQNESVATFNELLARMPNPTEVELLHVVCSACEFENVKVRQEELKEIDELKARSCPLAVKSTVDESAGKSNVLLQSFISHAKITSFTLISDTNYIASNAGRVARALFEMCLKRGMAGHAAKLLRIAKSVDKRVWWFHTPLRQFSEDLPNNIFPAIESRGYASFDYTTSLLEMGNDEVGQLCHWHRGGATIRKHVGFLPFLSMTCSVQPLSRAILKFTLTLTSMFDWHSKWCGGAQGFWLWVEDGENERVYHQEYIRLSKRSHPEVMEVELTIPAFEPLPPQYYVKLTSDQFVGVEQVLPVSFKNLMLPEKSSPYTDLLDLTPLPVTALLDAKYESLYSHKFECFNPIQTQMFHVLYHTDRSVLLGAPTGSGKTIVAELAILRLNRVYPGKKTVYIAPLKSLARERLKEWKKNLGTKLGWTVLELSGDTTHDSRSMARANVLVCTPEKWDLITRGWQEDGRQFTRDVGLLVIDEIHLLGEERGAVLEAIVSRTRYISELVKSESGEGDNFVGTRIVGLSTALANPVDLSEWMGISFEPPNRGVGMYNFRPSVRPIPMEVHIQGFPGRHYCPRMATMNKPCYAAIREHSPGKPVIIFVASRRQTRLTALDLISYAAGDENPSLFLIGQGDVDMDLICETIGDGALKHTLQFGIGLHHAGLSGSDRDVVEKLFLDGQIQVLVATSTLAWGVNLPAHLVIVKGTEFFDGKTSRYVDYPVTDVLQMMGRAGRPQFDNLGVACVLVQEGKKNFYRKFLYDPFPVESKIQGRICEILNAEIATGTVQSFAQAAAFLKWSYFYRRLLKNPSYYGCEPGLGEEKKREEVIEEFILAMVKETVEKLKGTNCLSLVDAGDSSQSSSFMGKDEDRIGIVPTALGKAASKYYLHHKTPFEMREGARGLRDELSAAKKTGGEEEAAVAEVIRVVSYCTEMDELPVRHNEENLNEDLSLSLRWGVTGEMDFLDPHCKCWLLIQAWLDDTQELPISDYINDTRSVVDQLGRLFAAMLTVSCGDGEALKDGMVDVAAAIITASSCVRRRCYPPRDCVFQQISGIVGKGDFEDREARCARFMDKGGWGSLRELREKSLGRSDDQFLKKLKSAGGFKAGLILEGLSRIPFVEVKATKPPGKEVVNVELKIRGGRGGRGKDNHNDGLTILVGSKSSRALLGSKNVGLGGGNRGGVETKEVAVALVGVEGRGVENLICRVVVDGWVGVDIEVDVEW